MCCPRRSSNIEQIGGLYAFDDHNGSRAGGEADHMIKAATSMAPEPQIAREYRIYLDDIVRYGKQSMGIGMTAAKIVDGNTATKLPDLGKKFTRQHRADKRVPLGQLEHQAMSEMRPSF